MTTPSCAIEAEVAHSMIFTQPEDPLLRSVLALLRVAHDHGRVLNRAKVATLLYLADLTAVEAGGVAFSGATWRWESQGPFDTSQYRVEEALVTAGVITREHDPHSLAADAGLRLVEDVEVTLDRDLTVFLEKVVAEHGGKSAAALRDLSYETPPMAGARTEGERGVLLDLSRARRRKQYQALKERYRARLSHRTAAESDPGVGADLLEEMGSFAEARRRATTEALGEE